MRQISARSLVLDLLSTLRRGSMPVRALVEAAGLFGIAAGSVRVTLTRLLAERLIERDERGAYRLGDAARAVAERATAWRGREDQTRPWNGAWLAVLTARRTPVPRAAQRRHARALRLQGFRELERSFAVRPDNLAGGLAHVRAEGARLGLAPGALVFEVRGLDALSEARARALWDAAAQVADYRRLRRGLEASERRLPARGEAAAMTESFLLGGEALRLLALDPLLPDPIVPAAERAALVAALRRYDALGRAVWAGFLARHGVLHQSAPADTRALSRGESR